MTELTLCIESQELRSRLRAAALLMRATVYELSLDDLLAKRNLPAHWVLVDHGLDELGGLIQRFKEQGRKPEAQIIRFIDKPWQSYVYHDIPIFASIVRPVDPLAAVHILEKLIATKPLQFGLKVPVIDDLGPYSADFIRSLPMQNAVSQLQLLKRLPVDTVLIGPTGAGKDTAARWLHAQSGVKGEFIHVNCAALPEQLFEAELFGVMAGAFTGAQKDRPGKLESANNGTLYLDEMDSLPLSCQAKLLNALQYRGAIRLGGNVFYESSFRVIASTKASLPDLVRQNKFREDLHFRLSVSQVRIPALAERLEDIIPLYRRFLDQVSVQFGLEVPSLSVEECDELLSKPWPGNVRELHAFAQRHVIGLGSPCDDAVDLEKDAAGLKQRLLAFERAVLIQALQTHGGCARLASESLGIPLHSMYYRMKRFDLLEKVVNYSENRAT
ncbi:MAG: sigma 54-interacting transcriptional regulator [Gammaproteobacteria bacterium]|uniref:sigma 54-interacting transcriptional regulator n=1 Tax=Limnobacter sp. TaxID=2003368 RepID=UPI001D6399AC|nr:sigma 54-interacting transcriptional regulator [Limnobacter sp.]MBU0783053.1 sigma 54-interacting transcriptional regulator [Gammaproteobacteria bacterium]MBU0849640.1 sigma 54-interacting transcriptional regulator [Gammaproteobacteria bacterium]MBU1266091.1 sigma 54-interacting transcriptional regulator [Gammaproteobacteria bacterium]MBU1529282.1 sigma 54-interacting transcriptional regulator [Gammaproteobacteria bacterium]MBU1779339.1 sigma 54-interacting transcriptional regulator [Gammap